MNRCIKMCLVHDMAESVIGDIPPCANIPKSSKHQMEMDAMVKFKKLLSLNYNENEIWDLWNEYENQKSLEALFVKDLDRIELLFQAYEYEIEYPHLNFESFFESTRSLIKTEFIIDWMKQLDHFRCLGKSIIHK